MKHFLRMIVALTLLLIGFPANAAYRGALYDMVGPTPVSNSYYTTVYTYMAFPSKEYDTDNLMDTTNHQQFIVPAGVSKVRLKCGFIWSPNNRGYTQMVITKNNLSVPGLVSYPGITPQNQPSMAGGTTDDFSASTHVLPVVSGDTFQCAAWQMQPTGAVVSRDVLVSSFSIEILE